MINTLKKLVFYLLFLPIIFTGCDSNTCYDYLAESQMMENYGDYYAAVQNATLAIECDLSNPSFYERRAYLKDYYFSDKTGTCGDACYAYNLMIELRDNEGNYQNEFGKIAILKVKKLAQNNCGKLSKCNSYGTPFDPYK